MVTIAALLGTGFGARSGTKGCVLAEARRWRVPDGHPAASHRRHHRNASPDPFEEEEEVVVAVALAVWYQLRGYSASEN